MAAREICSPLNRYFTQISLTNRIYLATSFSFGGRIGVPGENHRPWASNWETLSLAAAYKAKKDETELSDMTGRFLDLSLMLQMALFSAWWIFFSSSKTGATLLAWYSFTLGRHDIAESGVKHQKSNQIKC
jgi:hypothetical protein